MGSARTKERYAIGLYRVSTAEQGQSGLGMEAQRIDTTPDEISPPKANRVLANAKRFRDPRAGPAA